MIIDSSKWSDEELAERAHAAMDQLTPAEQAKSFRELYHIRRNLKRLWATKWKYWTHDRND